ncbi:TraU family protein [Escherichia coli]
MGSTKVSQGKVQPQTRRCRSSSVLRHRLSKRIGLAIGYWEPMALTDVTRSPGCMVNLGFSLPEFGKTAQGTAKKEG